MVTISNGEEFSLQATANKQKNLCSISMHNSALSICNNSPGLVMIHGLAMNEKLTFIIRGVVIYSADDVFFTISYDEHQSKKCGIFQ